jgi:NTP pyrophosphatase (non-canonical NTP hydrolase)
MEYEAEIILMEECGELVQALSKVIRTEGRANMVSDLSQEIADVQVLIDVILEKYNITEDSLKYRRRDKIHKLQRWSNLYDNET